MAESVNTQSMKAFARDFLDHLFDSVDLVVRKSGFLVPPRKLRRCFGHGGFIAPGEVFFKYFVDLCTPKKTDHVLDVGWASGAW